MRKANSTSFKPGQSGNPAGRKPGTGCPLIKAKNIITRIFEKYSDDFEAAMDEDARNDIRAFYARYVTPFMPKEFAINDITPNKSKDREEIMRELDSLEKRLSEKNKLGKKSA